ncbi:MAG TPA: glycosyl transferase family 2, partial [Chthoniobacteraceae bacterium]
HLTSNYAYLLLLFLCLLLHPSTGGISHGSWRGLLLNIAIFFSASAPAAVFYIYCQKELHPKTWMKEIVLLPALLGLGIGLAVNNARAVLEAMLGHKSEFTRTPKYGIQSKTQSWKRSRYAPLKSVAPFIELGFAAYFTYFLIFAVLHGQWLSIPFLLLFQMGFAYVALCSIAQWVPALRFPGRDTGASLAA